MLRKIWATLTLLLLISSTAAAIDQISSGDVAEPGLSLLAQDCNAAPPASLTVGANRLVRAKSLIKSWLSSPSAMPDVRLACALFTVWLTRRFSRYDVYQQINVYRL
jgi:hypothetical protein